MNGYMRELILCAIICVVIGATLGAVIRTKHHTSIHVFRYIKRSNDIKLGPRPGPMIFIYNIHFMRLTPCWNFSIFIQKRHIYHTFSVFKQNLLF